MTHWITALCCLGLLITGIEIIISHPRFYWGENGNSLTQALFSFPIPSSRRTVPTGYAYVLPDQNGWSRYLHFEAAWGLVLTGLWYVAFGVISGHFRKNLAPNGDGRSYNTLQRTTYLAVVFVMFPLIVWTGLAMSPAFVSAVPAASAVFGGRQSARTIHFLLSVIFVVFVLVHVMMVWRAGFTRRVSAMITGRGDGEQS